MPDLTSWFKNFTLLGAGWVLWVLVFLSILSIGIMIERFMFFWARRVNLAELELDAKKALRDGSKSFKKKYAASPAMPVVVAIRGVEEAGSGIDAVGEVMNSEKTRAKQDHERYLAVLGTLGNNAPFIGLFGTVLGIIMAFNDLSKDAQGGAEAVHDAISEALVATAVGLLVAIPAVIAFNYYNRKVREAVTSTDTIAHAILGELHAQANNNSTKEAA